MALHEDSGAINTPPLSAFYHGANLVKNPAAGCGVSSKEKVDMGVAFSSLRHNPAAHLGYSRIFPQTGAGTHHPAPNL
jgi:hypothetical protein